MGLSRRAYARHRAERGLVGGNLQSVQRALKRGRIHLEADDTIDPERADREWAANTDLSEAPTSVVERHAAAQARPDTRHVGDTARVTPLAPPGDAPPPPVLGGSLAENNAVKAYWQAKQAELDYLEAAKELVPAADVRGRIEDVFRRCRTKLLGVPSRLRQRLPHLTSADVAEVEEQVREALEELAAAGVA